MILLWQGHTDDFPKLPNAIGTGTPENRRCHPLCCSVPLNLTESFRYRLFGGGTFLE